MPRFVDHFRSTVMGAEQEVRRSLAKPQPVSVPVCKRSDYLVGPKVGGGSFAVVHRGREVSGRGRDVAIKVVRSQGELGLRDADPKGGCAYIDVLNSILSEIDILEAMGSHPNIVELLGQDRVDHVMVMEQASSDLYTVIKKMGSDQGVPEHMIRSWAQCICAGVSHVHACGYVHQDLKSSNVLVFGDRSAKICDFGLSVKMPDKMMTVDRELSTLWYRAPELLMCESVYSHKIDEWAVGCMLLEMVIGVPPFRGNTECTCHCSQVTHRNFNSDQLARIFLITGSPSNEMLKRVPCEGHIRGWPKAPRKLERTVEKRLTSDRFRLGGTCVHSITHAEMDNAIGNWSSVIAAMLELDPVSRWTCSQAYEVLTRMVAADKRCAPGGPQAASPSIEASTINGSGSDVPDIMIEIGLSSREEDDTLPLVMRSPERDLPGHNISLFYRHCNDSKHTRLAAEGNRKQAVCGTGLVAGRAHEQTLQLRTGGQEMQRPRIDDGAAETPTRPLPPPDRPYAAMFRKQASMSPPRSRTLYAAKDPLQARAEMHAVGSRQSRAFSRSQSGPASPSVSVSLDGVEQDGVVKQRQLHQQRIWVPSLSSMSPPRSRTLYAAKDPLQARAEMHAVGSRQSRAFSRSQSGPASPSVSVSLDGVEQDGVVKQRQLHQQRIWVPSLSSMSPPRTRSEQRMEAFKAQERHKSPEAHKSKSPSPSREQDVVKRVRGTAKLQSSIDQRVSEFQ